MTMHNKGGGGGVQGGLEMTVKMKTCEKESKSTWTWDGSGSALGWKNVTHPFRLVPSELRPTEAERKSLGTANVRAGKLERNGEIKGNRQKATTSDQLLKKQWVNVEKKLKIINHQSCFTSVTETLSDFSIACNIQWVKKVFDGNCNNRYLQYVNNITGYLLPNLNISVHFQRSKSPENSLLAAFKSLTELGP